MFLSSSRGECHQEVISTDPIDPMMTSVRKLWGLHSVSFTLLAHSERPRLIGGSEVSMEKKTEREKIDRSNQSGSILF